MPLWMRKWAARAAGQVPTLLTLTLLGGLASWGAHHDWKISPRESKVADQEDPTAVKVIPDPATPPGKEPGSLLDRLVRIEFPSAEAVDSAGIRCKEAKAQTVQHFVTANGMLDYEPSRVAQLAPRAPGTIWRVYKAMGDAVKKGEVLALIESAEVGRTKADFMQSMTQVDVRQKTYQRLRAAGASVPEGTLYEAEASLREARIRLTTDQQRLLNLGLAIRLDEVAGLSEERFARYLRLLGLPEAIHRPLDPETLTANLLPLTAPFDGLVVRHPHAAPGEVVDTTHSLFVVGDVSHLHIDLEVHLEDIAYLRVGQVVTFVPENQKGYPGEAARGPIVHISPEVNEKTRNVPVHAEVENQEGRFRPNTFGTGRILVREVPRAVAVPNEAVQTVDQNHVVFVRLPDGKSFQVRPVRPGLRDGGVTEVEGVGEGEQVVTAGSYVLKSELLKDRIGGGD